MTAKIIATYRVRCAANEADARAREMALEQTVEVPDHLVTDPHIRATVLAETVGIAAIDGAPDRQRIALAYNAELANGHLSQLLNLVFGNISILPGIVLEDLVLPETFLAHFRGPNFGREGLRARTGVYGRPLLATALKPRGASTAELAAMAGAFAENGGDIVKDDHGLGDDSFREFEQRVRRCHEAVLEANARTGRNCLYLPNVIAPAGELERYAEFAVRSGIPGMLICPLITGLDTVRHLAAHYPLIYMAHPSFSGSYYVTDEHGIDPGLLMGTLFRLAGCDVSVFPNYGGRFSLSRATCMAIHHHLACHLGGRAVALPAPAGGMQLDRIGSMAETYGIDAVFLIGGALLSHPGGVGDGTKAFLDAIRGHFNERLEQPQTPFASACEWPGTAHGAPRTVLNFRGDFSWEGRTAIEYKDGQDLPFAGVKRVELLGKGGERGAFDLRYFEVAPKGYTSMEKHVHTHAIIVARGEGVLLRNGERTALTLNDVAYIDSLEVHQLRNEGDEPFGFYCIVDRERDRPQAP